MKIRTVEAEDCQLLWEWANDKSVRASAFNQEMIAWQTHNDWFYNKIRDINCYQYIGINDDEQPVGQVRFDITGDIAELDFSVGKSERGKGYGYHLLVEGIKRFYQDSGQSYKLFGRVKSNNSASMKLFSKLGFVGKREDSNSGELVIYVPMVVKLTQTIIP